MLLAVNYALSNGFDLGDADILKSKFTEYRSILSQMVRIRSISDIKKLNLEGLLMNLV